MAGEAPARTIAAAREFMAGHAEDGRLTDQTKKRDDQDTPVIVYP